MSDVSQGPGWWQASDGKWYPPESAPPTQPVSTSPWAETTAPPAVGATNRKWYDQTWFWVVSLLFCFPVGLFVVWRKPWKTGVKIAATVAVAALVIAVAATSGSTKSSNTASTPVATTTTTIPPTTTTLSPAALARQRAAAKAAAAAAVVAARRQAAANAAAEARAAAAARAAYLKSITPVVLWQQSGSGIQNGQQFTVPSNVKGWNEVWSYNCSGFGGSGNFITTINGSSSDSGENQLGPGGSGKSYYYDTGTFSIDVNSECNWTDEAVTIP